MAIFVSHPISTRDFGVSGWYGVWYENCHIITYLSYTSCYNCIKSKCKFFLNVSKIKHQNFMKHWKCKTINNTIVNKHEHHIRTMAEKYYLCMVFFLGDQITFFFFASHWNICSSVKKSKYFLTATI
jgi:hypothetical protein